MPTATETQPSDEVREAVAALEGKPRSVGLADIEIRAKSDGGFHFVGTASVFDQLSEDLGGWREMVKRGAFKNVLEDDVRFLINHNPDLVMARTTSGTLSLEEKPRGLAVEADVAAVSYAEDLRVLLERGDVSQMSIAFRVAEDSWFEDPDSGELIRTVHKFEALFDASVVTFPAFPQTDAAVAAVRKLERGETLTSEERAAVQGLLEHSTQPDPEERADRADGKEPDGEASGDESRAVESTEAQGGLSVAAARFRMRERIARL